MSLEGKNRNFARMIFMSRLLPVTIAFVSLKKIHYALAYFGKGSYALADSCGVLDDYSVFNAPKSGLKAGI